jgi:hypothetical protein
LNPPNRSKITRKIANTAIPIIQLFQLFKVSSPQALPKEAIPGAISPQRCESMSAQRKTLPGGLARKEFSEKYARAGVFPRSAPAPTEVLAQARAELAAGWVDDTADRSGVQGRHVFPQGVNAHARKKQANVSTRHFAVQHVPMCRTTKLLKKACYLQNRGRLDGTSFMFHYRCSLRFPALWNTLEALGKYQT